MDLFTRNELRTLMEGRGQLGVSIYMPTHRVGDTRQDPIRFKNLLREAEERLEQHGMSAPDAEQMMKPARQLLSDALFWKHQADGLALFCAPGRLHHYRLPCSFEELAVVGERFHIKPLLPLLRHDGLFYVLAVSQNRARLLQCTGLSVRIVTPESMPQSLAEALRYDDPEKQHQLHTVGPGPAIFHGHGVGKDDDKVNILRYFQQIDRGLRDILNGEKAPLVIAAVEYLQSIYREANTYPHLLNEGIRGNPDELSEEVLQKQAWGLLTPHLEREHEAALDDYHSLAGTGRTVNGVKQVALAAYDGRVSTLFVALDVQQWGTFDEERRKFLVYEEPVPGTEDLLDFAAVQTLAKGGTVYALEARKIPDGEPIAAILHY